MAGDFMERAGPLKWHRPLEPVFKLSPPSLKPSLLHRSDEHERPGENHDGVLSRSDRGVRGGTRCPNALGLRRLP